MKPKMLENFKDLTRTNLASFKGKSKTRLYSWSHVGKVWHFAIIQLMYIIATLGVYPQ